MRTFTSSCLRLAVSFYGLACAAHAGADAIDDTVRAEMANQRIPGLALAIVRDGRPADVRTYGIANVETDAPVTKDTEFRVGSVAKQFIATGTMLLVADGRLALDDSIAKYIADVPAAWKPITIRQLLAHTSGLRRESPAYDPQKTKTDIELVRGAYAAPLLESPGNQHVYSNLGYYVLAEIVTRAAGKPWQTFLEDRVFAPLAMTETHEQSHAHAETGASGYVFRDNSLTEAKAPHASRPGAGLVSSLADLVRWDAALTKGELLPSDTQTQMWTSSKLASGAVANYGYGWWIDAIGGHKRVRHGGENPGFRAEYARFPDDGLSVIVLANGESLRADALALELASQYLPSLSPNRKSIALDGAALKAYAGRYELAPDNILTIAVDGEGLSVQSSAGGAQYKMLPEAPSAFFISQDETYLFTLFRGLATELVIRAGAQEMRAKRTQ